MAVPGQSVTRARLPDQQPFPRRVRSVHRAGASAALNPLSAGLAPRSIGRGDNPLVFAALGAP